MTVQMAVRPNQMVIIADTLATIEGISSIITIMAIIFIANITMETIIIKYSRIVRIIIAMTIIVEMITIAVILKQNQSTLCHRFK
jgi:hypothetical protein